MFLEMGSGGKTSHAKCSGGQTSHALGSGGESSHAKRHGLLKFLKQQNYISDSFSVFILLRSNQKCNIYIIQIKQNQTT